MNYQIWNKCSEQMDNPTNNKMINQNKYVLLKVQKTGHQHIKIELW